MSNALTVHNPKKPALVAGGGLSAIVPQDVEQAFRMAQLIAASGIAPRDMQTPEKIVTSIITGMEVGLLPMQAVQSIAVVNGRPTIWGDAALGLVMASGLCEDFAESVEGDGDKMAAVCTVKRVGLSSPSTQRFSVQDAKDAGLWGKAGPWKQYPRRMLAMRARAFALRNLFPDVLKGLGVREEVRDFSGPTVEHQARQDAIGSTAAALAAQAGAVDVEAEPVEQTEDRGEQMLAQDAAVEAEAGADTIEPGDDTVAYWTERFAAGLTKEAVESTFTLWMREHFATFSADDRKAVTRAKNQRIFEIGQQ